MATPACNCNRTRREARISWYLDWRAGQATGGSSKDPDGGALEVRPAGLSKDPDGGALDVVLLLSDSTRDPDNDAPSSPRRRREGPSRGDLLRRGRFFCVIGGHTGWSRCDGEGKGIAIRR